VLRVGSVPVTVKPGRADVWIAALSSENFTTDIIPGMLPPADAETVVTALVRGELEVADLKRAAEEATTAAAGIAWWKATKLVGWASGGPAELWGRMVLQGADPARLTFASWCAAVYALAMEGLDEKGREKRLFSFNSPPPGVMDFSGWMMDPVPEAG
jgi:hypothetical protein